MKRFDLVDKHRGFDCWKEMEAAPDDGDWVLYEDAQVQIGKSETEIERLRAALTGLLQSLESDVHGMIDARAAEARAVLAGSPSEPDAPPADQWTPAEIARFEQSADSIVQCRCGWMGKVSALKSLPEFKRGCPECSAEFKPLSPFDMSVKPK